LDLIGNLPACRQAGILTFGFKAEISSLTFRHGLYRTKYNMFTRNAYNPVALTMFGWTIKHTMAGFGVKN